MSLLKVEIRPNIGSPVELNTTDINGNHLYPVSKFDIQTNIDTGQPAKKMAAPGQWPRFMYPDAMSINAQGAILGIGSTDTLRAQDYMTKRLALIDALLPPLTVLTTRKHGVLRIRMDGMTEDADADVVCISQSVPLRALFPANSEFMITWTSWEPYFVGVSTSTKYQLG